AARMAPLATSSFLSRNRSRIESAGLPIRVRRFVVTNVEACRSPTLTTPDQELRTLLYRRSSLATTVSCLMKSIAYGERLLGTHRPAKRAWLLRGRPRLLFDVIFRQRLWGGHGGPPLHVFTSISLLSTICHTHRSPT